MRRVLRDPTVGSLLIQSDGKSGEAILLHSMLPISVRGRHRAEVTWVFLLDAQVHPPSISFLMDLRLTLSILNVDNNECIRNHGHPRPS
jgi:hypothetical protein